MAPKKILQKRLRYDSGRECLEEDAFPRDRERSVFFELSKMRPINRAWRGAIREGLGKAFQLGTDADQEARRDSGS